MTLGSFFDGVGTWQLAAVRAGIKPVWSSEIDAFACAVSRKHFPSTVQLGDINQLADVPKVDVITASSPCQDISIAGKQGGIRCERSGLFFKAIVLVRRSRPEFFVWENVPHVLGRREDFKAVLEAVTQTEIPIPERGFANAGVVDFDGGQLAWRILNAEFFGTAQRRRRVFLVADFAGRRAAEILFEPASLHGNSSTGTGEKQTVAARTRTNFDFAVYDMTHADEVIRPVRGDKVNCLNARVGTGGNQIQLVAFGIDRATFNQGVNAKFKPVIERELQPTLTSRGAGAVCNLNVVRRLTPVECERLMGLPDNFTEGGSDTKRYKALGNALALPVATWILLRIKEAST